MIGSHFRCHFLMSSSEFCNDDYVIIDSVKVVSGASWYRRRLSETEGLIEGHASV